MKLLKKIEKLFDKNKIHHYKIYKKLWYISNKENIRKKQKKYLKENKKKVYISRLQYYLKNRDIISQKNKEKYARKKMQKMQYRIYAE